ncbi:hypothetical protein ZEAMMB73_Zm00001d045707 [Zea mays]|uniref:Uncharacterized protein n=1 Tax=Zea mays TaxID=4577 RepID=A0A1D6NYF7_MAIZE|nr:hypothetical protein ZEAMMB73_Zm00001d045707 [Zea mays]
MNPLKPSMGAEKQMYGQPRFLITFSSCLLFGMPEQHLQYLIFFSYAFVIHNIWSHMKHMNMPSFMSLIVFKIL